MSISETTLPVTVIILTLNEERNLPGAIESVQNWVEEVFVVDSCSVDRTVDVAIEHRVKIVQRPFTNYGNQWNWAIEHLPIKTPWVLKLDADERVSAELQEEIRTVVSNNPGEDAFVVPVRLWFMGKRMHPKMYTIRLWRKGNARFSGVIVNERLLVNGATGRLRCCIEHMDSPDLHHWWDKQNCYTTMLAIQKAKGWKLSAKPRFFGTPLERRMFFISIFFRIPFRYQLQWLHEMFVRGAWRDGMMGLTWARLRVEARRMRELKEKEMRTTGHISKIPRLPAGDFDPRVLASPLQKSICEGANEAAFRSS